jgi:hypothetical protein
MEFMSTSAIFRPRKRAGFGLRAANRDVWRKRFVYRHLGEPANYFAAGPVFATTTKQTDKRPIGTDGVRRLGEQAGSDVVLTAAAGITLPTLNPFSMQVPTRLRPQPPS